MLSENDSSKKNNIGYFIGVKQDGGAVAEPPKLQNLILQLIDSQSLFFERIGKN